MSIELNEVVPKAVMQNLINVAKCLNSDQDIRKCLSLLSPLGHAFRGLLDLYDDSKVRFASFLIVEQFGNAQSVYDGHTDGWYELNAENVSELRVILVQYCTEIAEAIGENDYARITQATEEFFGKFHSLARVRTTDVREE